MLRPRSAKTRGPNGWRLGGLLSLVAVLLPVLGRAPAYAQAQPQTPAQPRGSRADLASSDAHVREARRLIQRGRAMEACAEYVEADKDFPRPEILAELAECYKLAGFPGAAFETLQRAKALAERTGGVVPNVSARTADLTRRARVRLVVHPSVDRSKLELRLDARAIAASADVHPVDPELITSRTHELVATAPGYKPVRWEFQLRPGEEKVFTIGPLEPVRPPKRFGDAQAGAAAALGGGKDSSGLLPLPVIFYSPETHLGLGAFGMYYFHTGSVEETRSSNISASIIGTTKKQVTFELGTDLWLAQDFLHLGAEGNVVYFPDIFVGIGNDTPSSDLELFTERSYAASLRAQVRVLPGLYAGAKGLVDYRENLDREPNRQLLSGTIAGAAGGFYLGGGPAVSYDTRDNTYAAARGTYVDVGYLAYPPAIQGDFRFSQLKVDARQYIAFGSTVLAFQMVGQLSEGSTPFYRLSRIGGPELRGITLGRFRDNHLLEGQTEFRFPLWGPWGATTFIGAGQVAHTVSAFTLDNFKPAGGAGLRFAIVPEERINIRLDFAYSYAGLAYYLDLGEAF